MFFVIYCGCLHYQIGAVQAVAREAYFTASEGEPIFYPFCSFFKKIYSVQVVQIFRVYRVVEVEWIF